MSETSYDYFSIGGRVIDGRDSKPFVEANSGDIGASRPAPNGINVEKGGFASTGDLDRRDAYEDISETGSLHSFSARTTSGHSSNLATNLPDVVQDTKSSLDSSRPHTSANDRYPGTFSSSPIFSYSSSPETAVSFDFSPTQRRRLMLNRADSGCSCISSTSSHHHHHGSPDLSTQRPNASEDLGMTPSSSYASTSATPASFPFQDRIGSFQDKGKGKQRETRSPTPVGPASVTDDGLTEIGLEGQTSSNSHPGSQPDGSLSESFDSKTQILEDRRSRIGLSFSDQRFTRASRRASFTSPPVRRSHSAHSRRSPTPVPLGARSRSGDRYQSGQQIGPRRRSTILTMLSLNGRGRSTSRAKGKLRSLRRAFTDVNTSLSEQRPRMIPGSGVSSIPSSSRPTLTSLRLEYAPGTLAHTGGEDVGGDTSVSIAVSGPRAGGITVAAPVTLTDGRNSQSRLSASSPTPRFSGLNTPSFRLQHPVDGTLHSLLSAGAEHLGGLSSSPLPSPSALPPPRLKFVGRANTAPSLPFTEITSTVASGSSSSALTTALLMPPGLSSHFRPRNGARDLRPRPSDTNTPTSPAYSYIHTLPPLTKPIPQPDGCGQVLLEEALLTPGVLVVPPSPYSSTRSRSTLLAGRCPWDLFDTLLPYELRVEVFRTLLRIHIADHDALVLSQEWSVGMAGGTMGVGLMPKREQRQQVNAARWVGLERGLKELVKISRVRPLCRLCFRTRPDRTFRVVRSRKSGRRCL
ncbi:hypothetical protein FRB95_009657 [Tulasnella sp. JGI-2019a]|nr:hypothetical protein FRB95_009657 [Tulasnella sp. JGI-2019a]